MTTLRLGIAGLGSVGSGLITLIQTQSELRLPGRVELNGVTARSRAKKRPVDISEYPWFDDPMVLASSENIDVFVELIGGADGPAKLAVEAALKAGKHVVTGNKALIATHGTELAKLAEENNVNLLFEAAVAGGIPIVRVLRDSLSGVKTHRLLGILNGTCNYLTTEMLETGRDYEEVLEDAKSLGYAESDPFLDVSGTDAAHKIAILSAIAFSSQIDFFKVEISGVENLRLADLKLAKQLDLTVKLIASATVSGDDVSCMVEPVAIPMTHNLSHINGTLNAVIAECEGLGDVTLTGHGAGSAPTASAVMGDVSSLFSQDVRQCFGVSPHHTTRHFGSPEINSEVCALIIAQVEDKPGVLAQLTDALASESVSVDKLVQNSANADGIAQIGIITHKTTREALYAAINTNRFVNSVQDRGIFLPIL